MRKSKKLDEVFTLLDEKAAMYNVPNFIEDDPVSVPHRFSLKQDIEISAFLTAMISWGNRKAILKSSQKMLNFMDGAPYDFIKNSTWADLKVLQDPNSSLRNIHRTFSGEDFLYFLKSFKLIYAEHDSLEALFYLQKNELNFSHAIERFREKFLQEETHRSHKHISSPYKNSAAKRLIMFLRWMVRKDNKGVDFGLWENISPKYLSIPLDVHTANISRQLGILHRKQNDWKAVEELDSILRKYNTTDPAIYDFALFGMGVNKDF